MMHVTAEDGLIDDQHSTNPLAHFLVYAIYHNPTDYPGKYVVREWRGENPLIEPLYVGDNLDHARLVIPFGKTCIGPDALDPVIVETWI